MTKDEIAKAVKNNEYINMGNIVAFGDTLYIVVENDTHKHIMRLLNASYSNSCAMPSMNWPSEETGYAAVKLVAETMREFFDERIIDKAFTDFGDL